MGETIKVISINGTALPTPARGVVEGWYQIVDSARNANGVVVAQKIGRRQLKLDSLVWPWLTAAEWGKVLDEIDKFYGTLQYFDARKGAKRTLKVYWGDATAEPYWVNSAGNPTHYTNCKCNIIDTGA